MNTNTVVKKREKQFLLFVIFTLIFLGGYHIGKVKTTQESELLYIQSYYNDLERALSDLELTLSSSDNWHMDKRDNKMDDFERLKANLYNLQSVYNSDYIVKSEVELIDINVEWIFDHLLSILTVGFMYNTHTISHEAFDADGVISEREQALLTLMYDTIEPLSEEMYDYRQEKRTSEELTDKIHEVYEGLKMVFNEAFYLNYNEVN
ncbi:MAG: hypothetical protein JEZ08_04455 [Clostridiales bacterium]|nr:hypothetical protein [Clostridiales bacterium]